MEHTLNFDGQNFDKIIVGIIGETLYSREILTNRQPFVKFAKLFHCQTFALLNGMYISSSYTSNMLVSNKHIYILTLMILFCTQVSPYSP